MPYEWETIELNFIQNELKSGSTAKEIQIKFPVIPNKKVPTKSQLEYKINKMGLRGKMKISY